MLHPQADVHADRRQRQQHQCREQIDGVKLAEKVVRHQLNVIYHQEKHHRGADEEFSLQPLRHKVDEQRRAAVVADEAGKSGHRRPESAFHDGDSGWLLPAREAAPVEQRKSHAYRADQQQQPTLVEQSETERTQRDAHDCAGKDDAKIGPVERSREPPQADDIHRAEDRQHDAGRFRRGDDERHERYGKSAHRATEP